MRNNNFAPLNNMAHWKEQNLVLWSRQPKMWRPHMWTPGPFWIVSKLHRSKVYRQAHIRTLTWFNYWNNRLQLTMSLWQNKDSAHWTHQYFLSKGLRTMTCSHMLGQVSSVQTKACRYKDVSSVSERRPKLSSWDVQEQTNAQAAMNWKQLQHQCDRPHWNQFYIAMDWGGARSEIHTTLLSGQRFSGQRRQRLSRLAKWRERWGWETPIFRSKPLLCIDVLTENIHLT